MNEKLVFYLSELVRYGAGASDQVIAGIEKQTDFIFPKEYIDVMKVFNGGEGEVGENGWLILFPVEELITTNENYSFLMNQIPDYFLFGKDAADTGYAFHKKKHTYHAFGLMSDFKTDAIEFCGYNFLEFIEYLYKQ